MNEETETDWLTQADPNATDTLAAMMARGEGVTFASPLKTPTVSPGDSLWLDEEERCVKTPNQIGFLSLR